MTNFPTAIKATKKIVQTPNPYSPQPAEHGAPYHAERHGLSNRRRVLTAFAMGLGCCLIGPVFLASYWAYHGIGPGFLQSVGLFGITYVAPGLIGVAVGLLIGYPLSLLCPSIQRSTRRWMLLALTVMLYAFNGYLLIAGKLNFATMIGPIALPAFSTTCASLAVIPTAVYLATSGTRQT